MTETKKKITKKRMQKVRKILSMKNEDKESNSLMGKAKQLKGEERK